MGSATVMTNKIIPQQEFDNIVLLFYTKEIENIQLGICLVEGQKCYQQFMDYFGMSIQNYARIFNNVVLVINQNNNIKYIIGHILYYHCDISKINIMYQEEILIHYPELAYEFNFTNLNKSFI